MEQSKQVKIIGGLIGLWGLVRLVGSAILIKNSSPLGQLFIDINAVKSINFLIELLGFLGLYADIAIGLILLAGSIGILLKKQAGFYTGLLGILLVLGSNIYNFAVGTGGNIITILIVTMAGYYLYDTREAFN